MERQRTEIAHRQILADATGAALDRIENASTADDLATQDVVRAAREQLVQEQFQLGRWRQQLGAGKISKTQQGTIFAHPEPRDPDDRIEPPQPSAVRLAAASHGDRAAWWEQHGRAWWQALHFADLAPGYQARLLTDFPGLRNGDGIPASVRNILNRRYIQLEIARMRKLSGTALFAESNGVWTISRRHWPGCMPRNSRGR